VVGPCQLLYKAPFLASGFLESRFQLQ
jgi:hypothetical protein